MLFVEKCKELGEYGERLLKEYDYEENEKHGTDINQLTQASSVKVYWTCSICGYKWEDNIFGRVHTKNCPNCAKIKKTENTLYNWCMNNGEYGKQLLKEFEAGENDVSPHEISYGSNKKMQWKCKKGHTWTANPHNRALRMSECPYCIRKHFSLLEKFIYNALASIIPNMEENYRLPSKLKRYELDICIPDYKMVIEYDGYNWHEKPVDNKFPEGSKEQYKTDICKQYGLRLIHIYDGGDTEEAVMKNDIIQFKINESKRYEQLQKVIQIILKELNIEDTIDYKQIEKYTIDTYTNIKMEDTLAYNVPELIEEWDFENNENYTPETISAKSTEKVHWICKKCNQRWKATVNDRVMRHRGCPICANKKVVTGYNDLATIYPELAQEYHKKLNEKPASEIIATSYKKVYWQCVRCGHGKSGNWQSTIVDRQRKGKESGCPRCGYFWKTGKYKQVKYIHKNPQSMIVTQPMQYNF